MNNRKTKLKLTDFECNLLWGGMNEFRNKACSDGIPTEAKICGDTCHLQYSIIALLTNSAVPTPCLSMF